MVDVDNDHLYRAWTQGDEQAGRQLIGRLINGIHRFIRSMISGPDVDDAVQEVFARLAKRARSGAGIDNVKAFASGVARNVVREQLRARSRHPVDFSQRSLADLCPGQSENMLKNEEHHLLLKALHRMPVDDQLLIGLRYWQQLSTKALAQLLKIKPSTLRTQLQRARLRLEQLIAELAASPEARESTMGSLNAWAKDVGELAAARE